MIPTPTDSNRGSSVPSAAAVDIDMPPCLGFLDAKVLEVVGNRFTWFDATARVRDEEYGDGGVKAFTYPTERIKMMPFLQILDCGNFMVLCCCYRLPRLDT